MFSLEINPKAEAELQELATYIGTQKEGFGPLFLAEYEETVSHIRRFPKSKPIQRNKLRQALIGRFQVYILYKIYPGKIFVYRLIHAARKPSRRYKL
jgi:hypothetical protein